MTIEHTTDTDSVQELRPLPADGGTLIAASLTPLYLGLAGQTLARWRHEGIGPKFVRLGRRVFYRTSDLRSWIDSQVRQNTVNG